MKADNYALASSDFTTPCYIITFFVSTARTEIQRLPCKWRMVIVRVELGGKQTNEIGPGCAFFALGTTEKKLQFAKTKQMDSVCKFTQQCVENLWVDWNLMQYTSDFSAQYRCAILAVKRSNSFNLLKPNEQTVLVGKIYSAVVENLINWCSTFWFACCTYMKICQLFTPGVM